MSHTDSPAAPLPDPNRPATDPGAPAAPAPVDWSEESTAGEEDPGASLDLALDPPAGAAPAAPSAPAPPPASPSPPGR